MEESYTVGPIIDILHTIPIFVNKYTPHMHRQNPEWLTAYSWNWVTLSRRRVNTGAREQESWVFIVWQLFLFSYRARSTLVMEKKKKNSIA